MQWWCYGREKCAFVGTTVHRRPNVVWKQTEGASATHWSIWRHDCASGTNGYGRPPLDFVTVSVTTGYDSSQTVHDWVRQFTEGRTSCENKPKEPPPRTNRSEDTIARVEQMVMEDRRLTVRQYLSHIQAAVFHNTLRTGSFKLFKLFKRRFPGFLTILTL